MNVVITGGSGQLGGSIIEALIAKGHQVRVLSRSGGEPIAGEERAKCDITDFASIREQVRGMDVVIHLAAASRPSLGQPQEVFTSNTSGTFNVFQAAAEEGVKRVVQAGSLNALGGFFSVRDVPAQYFPIDEAHPTLPLDPYAFSKNVMEQTADFFWNRDRLPSITFRVPWVLDHRVETNEMLREMSEASRQLVEKAEAMEPAERAAWLKEHLDAINAERGARHFETEETFWKAVCAGGPLSDETRLIMNGRYNFWTFVDMADCADAFVAAALKDLEGSHVLNMANDTNWVGYDTDRIARLFHPETTERSRPLVGAESFVSTEKAAELIGYKATHGRIR